MTTGRRVYPDENGRLWMQPGDYGKVGGVWYARPPTAPSIHLTANLSKHQVTDHGDGTITVSPSIACRGVGEWHGHLERGVWREAE